MSLDHRAARRSTCLLLRTRRFERRTQDFLRAVHSQTGFAIAVAADESDGPLDCAEFPKVSVTRAAAHTLGLHCPPDFAWRCGDYALYLARRAMPEMTHFWIIEPDVRVSAEDYDAAFAPFDAHPAVDLIATDLRLSEPDHYWHPTMRERTPHVYRSLFALSRFSARALDVCLAERRGDGRHLWPRVMWPNDEAFTASVVIGAGLRARDLNAFGALRYTRDTFGFFRVHRGEDFSRAPDTGLFYHPVLWGEDYVRKIGKLARGVPLGEVIRLKILRGIMIKRYQRLVGLDRILGKPRPVPRWDRVSEQAH